MTFITAGLAIAGLAGIAIPILIHLLARQRRKPIQWAAMRFLLEAYRKHRRRLQIEQLILLALRCLIIAILGVALARPILQATGVLDLGGSRTVFLVVDNGLAASLDVDGAGGTALDRNVETALEIIDALEPGDFVGLVTTGRPARALLVPPTSDHGGAIRMLESLEPTESPTDMPAALNLLASALEERSEERETTLVYMVSEFREGSASLDESLPAVLETLPENIRLLAVAPRQDAVGNTQVVAIEPVRTVLLPGAMGGSGQVTVRLERHGGGLERQVTRVRLEGPDLTLIEPKLVHWQPGETEAEVEFVVDLATQGERQVAMRASIDDDALPADNVRHTVLESREHIRAVLIDRRSFGFEPQVDRLKAGQWLRRALEPIENGPVQVIEVEPMAVGPADLRRCDVVLLPRPDLLGDSGWTDLRAFVDGGGLLIITPPGGQQVHQWVDRLGADLGLPWRVGLEIVDHPDGLTMADEQPAGLLLRLLSSEMSDLVAPVIAYRTLPLEDTAQAQEVLRFRDGSPALVVGGPAAGDDVASEGLVAYLAVAPDLLWTNLPTKPLMVPLVHELIQQGLGTIRGGREGTVGSPPPPGLPPASRAMVDDAGGRVGLDPAATVRPVLERGGLWTVLDAAGQELSLTAINVAPRSARTGTQAESAVTTWLAGSGPWATVADDEITAPLARAAAGSPIARLLLIALIALVILETVLARVFSHAIQGAETAGGAEGRLGGAAPAIGGLR